MGCESGKGDEGERVQLGWGQEDGERKEEREERINPKYVCKCCKETCSSVRERDRQTQTVGRMDGWTD